MSSSDRLVPTQRIPYPRLERPRLICDGIGWLRVFHARVETIEAPFYGINIWRVKRRKLAASVAHLIKLAAPGLNNAFGKVHALEFYDVDDEPDLVNAVLIYNWHSLPKVIEGAPPLSILPAHFRFLGAVEGYNWNLVKTLEPDPEAYAGMLTQRFHTDICRP